MFDTGIFEQQLQSTWVGKTLLYFEELESTNTYAKKLSRTESLHGAVILADAQTRGRGQHAKPWYTQAGENLTFSLIFEPSSSDRFIVLALACALAVLETCQDVTGESFSLKWPNDILYNGRKICGLLTEVVYNGQKVDRAIIGIGLNVNQSDFPEEIRHTATSLYHIRKTHSSREALLGHILSKIEYYYRLWNQSEVKLVHAINKKIIGYGEWVHLRVNGDEWKEEFKFLGINETGSLLVLNKDLEVNTFSYEQIRVHFNHSES